MPRDPRRRPAKITTIGAPTLTVKAAAGANADTKINVSGLKKRDPITAVINLTDGTVEAVKTQVDGGITIGASTASDKLIVIFTSVGNTR